MVHSCRKHGLTAKNDIPAPILDESHWYPCTENEERCIDVLERRVRGLWCCQPDPSLDIAMALVVCQPSALIHGVVHGWNTFPNWRGSVEFVVVY